MTAIINSTIEFFAARPFVFSARDVAAYAGLEGLEDTIEAALRNQCANKTILKLDEQHNGDTPHSRYLDWIDPKTGEVNQTDSQNGATFQSRYLGCRVAEQWWVGRMVRWATAGADCVTPAQLAGSMSLAFDNRRWLVPPPDLMAVGRRWAMVADGCVTGTFVFPWASVLRSNPQFMEPFRSLFSSDFNDLSFEPDDTVIDQALNCLTEREAAIIRRRFGLGGTDPNTLEDIGKLLGITRERVRQLENKVLRRGELKKPLWLKFAADFVQSGGSLLIEDSLVRPHLRLLAKVWELNTAHVIKLNISVIATEGRVAVYRSALSSEDDYLDTRNERTEGLAVGILQFLPHTDKIRMHDAEEDYLAMHIRRTRPRMLRHALRSLGRAAHFTEIAEECNRLFPDNQTSIHGWHSALSLCGQPDQESFGIVWIGRKGMYGLKEHGYSRPNAGLFDEVTQIVNAVFKKTQRPVSVEVVMAELSKKRRELNRTSVVMALSFDDRLQVIGGGRYAPKSYSPREPSKAPQLQYDIGAAFQAFSADEEGS